jgi:hypothetical protein
MIVYTFEVLLGPYTQKEATPMLFFTINSTYSSDKVQKLTTGDYISQTNRG